MCQQLVKEVQGPDRYNVGVGLLLCVTQYEKQEGLCKLGKYLGVQYIAMLYIVIYSIFWAHGIAVMENLSHGLGIESKFFGT